MKASFSAVTCMFVLMIGPPVADSQAGSEKKIAKVQPAKDLTEKKVAFEMRAVVWKRVLEWLSDHTGLPITSAHPPPTGTFTFIAPNRATYSTSEIIDLINDQLLVKSYLLIRRDASIQMVVADERIIPDQVPLIEFGDLAKRGRNELVSVALPLQKVGGQVGVKDLRKLLGPFGEAVVLTEMKRVVLRDTAGNLRKICKIAGADEQPAAPKKEPTPKKDDPLAPPAKAGDDFILRYVYLTEITRTEKSSEAVLVDRAFRRTTRLRMAPGYTTMTFVDDDDVKTEVRIKVLRIDARDVYFQAGSRLYGIHLGENLKEALARPLEPDAAKKLGLSVEK